MPTDTAGDDDVAEVLIAGESELSCASVARFVAGNGLRPRTCQRVADAHWLLTHPHRVELLLYLKDAVGFGVCGVASDLSIRVVELSAEPAPTEGQPGVDSLPPDWALASAAMDAMKNWVRSSEYCQGPASQERPKTPHPPRPDTERRVLLVEDDATLARAVSRALQRLGYTVIVAHSAGQAREHAEHAEEELAYALVDHRLPEPEGLELGCWLASLPQQIGVAVYSGAFDINLAVEAEDCGIVAVPRPKPAELPALLEHLRLRRQAVLASAATAPISSRRRGRPPRKAGPVSGMRAIVGTHPVTVAFRLRMDGLHVESAAGTIVIHLRSAERRILTALALAQGEPLSREVLGCIALGRTDPGADQSVKQHVSSVRGKLSEYEYDYVLRTTKDGKGYFLTQPVSVESAVAMRMR